MNNNYKERFLRNMGIMDEKQLQQIKNTKVAVAGLGLGGSIFIDLVRLGFENFHIADPDIYERTNINRQRCAKESTIGVRKDEALLKEARDINPDIKVKVFEKGVQLENLFEFLDGVKWVVDVVDVFAMKQKLALNAEANRRGIPVASCGALGFGAAVIVFTKGGPTFAELTGMSPQYDFVKNLERFLQFIAPEIPDYMADQLFRAMNRSTHIPFVCPGVEISAAFAASEIAKHMLNLGKRPVAPDGIYIDPSQLKIELFKADYRARVLKKAA